MVRFLVIGLLLVGATASQAATITYNASVGCNNTCVTVSLSWANLFPGIRFVNVEDDFGNFLFSLSTPPFPLSTGSIVPNPQTISGLSPSTVAAITNSSFNSESFSTSGITISAPSDPFANILLLDEDENVVAAARFIATVDDSAVPEPAVLSLTGLGMASLFFARHRIRARRCAS